MPFARQRGTVFRLASIAIALFLAGMIGTVLWPRAAGPVAIVILAALSIPVLRLGGAVGQLAVRIAAAPIKRRERPADVDEAPPLLVLPVILPRDESAHIVRDWVSAALPLAPRLPLVILADLPDADASRVPEDDALIQALDRALADERADGSVVVALRARRHDPVDQVWRGWERKRGKIVEFCRLLRGATTDFGRLSVNLGSVHTIVTIDADTRLRQGTIAALLAAADRDAAIVSPTIRDVTRTPRGLFERLWTAAVIDTAMPIEPSFTQGWLGRDLFCGKGLIRIDPFLAKIEGRIRDRTVLSHDHLEALLAGAVSTPYALIEEPVPTSRRLWAARQYRWMRGDFQLLPWIASGPLAFAERAYLAENLLLHLTPVAVAVAVATALLFLPLPLGLATSSLSLALLTPHLLLLPLDAARSVFQSRHPIPSLGRRLAAIAEWPIRSWITAFLYCGRDALLTIRALCVTLWRMTISGRHLVEWNDRAYLDWCARWSALAYVSVAAAIVALVLHGTAGAIILAALLAGWSFLPLAARECG
jgi:cyclic beta-1,2-glucan synthetase